jgi:hypothetical protein
VLVDKFKKKQKNNKKNNNNILSKGNEMKYDKEYKKLQMMWNKRVLEKPTK